MFVLDENYDIKTSYGNTYGYDVKLTLSDNSVFTEKDRVLLKIRSKREKKIVFSKVYKIKDGGFRIEMNNREAERIPPGAHEWDFTVYQNAKLDDKGYPIDGDAVITPFNRMLKYDVYDIVSKERG